MKEQKSASVNRGMNVNGNGNGSRRSAEDETGTEIGIGVAIRAEIKSLLWKIRRLHPGVWMIATMTMLVVERKGQIRSCQ